MPFFPCSPGSAFPFLPISRPNKVATSPSLSSPSVLVKKQQDGNIRAWQHTAPSADAQRQAAGQSLTQLEATNHKYGNDAKGTLSALLCCAVFCCCTIQLLDSRGVGKANWPWFVGICTPGYVTGPARGTHGSQCLAAARYETRQD
jgi:hypothetical protein